MAEKIPFIQVDTANAPALDAVVDEASLAGTEKGVLIFGKDATNKAQILKAGADGALAVTDNAGSLTVDDGGGSLTVDGSVSVSNLPATQAVSAASLPLPTGASTSALQTTGNSSLSSIDTKVTGLALDATLTGGSQKAILRGAAKGSTTAADVSSTPSGANHQALDVIVYDASGNPITSFGGTGAQGTPNSTANAWPVKVTDGTSVAAVKAASTPAAATDPAQVVAISPNNSVAVTAASLPLPSGASTETTLGTRLADATFTTRVNTLGQKTAAGSMPVVLASDQSALTVTANLGTVSGLALDATLTGNNQRTRLTDGTNIAAVKAASTAPVATDPALVVSLSPNTLGLGGLSDSTVTGNITTLNGTVTTGDISGQGAGTVSIFGGAWSAVLLVEGSTDGTNFVTLACRNATGGGQIFSTIVGGGIYRFSCGGLSVVRVRASSYASGSVPVHIRTTPSASTITLPESLPTGSNVIGAVTQSGTWTVTNTDLSASGTLNALAANATLAIAGRQGCNIAIAVGTLTGTVVPEISLDGGSTYHASYFVDPVTEARATSLVFASPNANTVRSVMVTPGTTHFRVRVSAFTSGSAVATVRATSVPTNSTRLEVGPTGTPIPPSATLIGGTDGTNLQPVVLKASNTTPLVTDPAIVVTMSPNSADAEKGQISVTAATAYPISILSHSYAALRLQVTGAFTATVVVQGSIDGSNWQTIQGFWAQQGVVASITAPMLATWMIGGFSYLRLSCSSYTSGTMTVDYTLTRSATLSEGGATSTPYPVTSIGDRLGNILPSGVTGATAIATTPTDLVRGTGSLSSATNFIVFSPVNASGVASLTGAYGFAYNVMRLQVQGTFTATAVVQGTVDGTVWTTLPGMGNGGTTFSTITGAGTFQANLITYNVSGFASVRVNCTSYASGTITVDYALTRSAMMLAANPNSTPYGVVTIGDQNGLATLRAGTPATTSDTALVTITAAPSSASVSSVATNTTSTMLMNTDGFRRGGTICNDSASILYVKFGTAASSISYTVALAPAVGGVPSYYEVPNNYTGIIHGVLATGSGTAKVTILS